MSQELTHRLRGTRAGSIAEELFTNSAHFPIVNTFVEMLREDFLGYLSEPDLYTITVSCLIQAFFLGSWKYRGKPKPLLGNLIGPTIYTVIEMSIEGPSYFFSMPSHIAYIGFSIAIGLLQQFRLPLKGWAAAILTIVEDVVRSSIVLAGYWIFEALTREEYASLAGFLSDESHVFVAIVVLLLGVLIGINRVHSQDYLSLLRATAAQLRTYSEWLLGPVMLSRAVEDPDALAIKRTERAVLFADIRGFTKWSESHSPEEVVSVVNRFYETAESAWIGADLVKTRFIGDEILLVFASPRQAAEVALKLQASLGELLGPYGVGVGIGLHYGPLVEGLMGSREVKAYDIMGDTVNTGKRICDAAGPGIVLMSSGFLAQLGTAPQIGKTLDIQVKGKSEPLHLTEITGLAAETC